MYRIAHIMLQNATKETMNITRLKIEMRLSSVERSCIQRVKLETFVPEALPYVPAEHKMQPVAPEKRRLAPSGTSGMHEAQSIMRFTVQVTRNRMRVGELAVRVGELAEFQKFCCP
jgi:hypothetical protein